MRHKGWHFESTYGKGLLGFLKSETKGKWNWNIEPQNTEL
jgi:hypothetical protein